MSELTARLALYGAIDQAIVESDDPGMRERASVVLPAYRNPRTPGWYDQMRGLIGNGALDDPNPFSALEQLAETSFESESASSAGPVLTPDAAVLAAHRVLAVWAMNSILQPDGKPGPEAISRALAPISAIGAHATPDAPPIGQILERRLEELANEPETAERFLDFLAEQGVVDKMVMSCARVLAQTRSRLVDVEVEPDSRVNAAFITSSVRVTGFSDPVATLGVLHPSRWPACLPTFWCSMDGSVDENSTDAAHHYVEAVGSCPSPWFTPCIRFTLQSSADEATLGYSLWDPETGSDAVNPGTIQDDRVVVDEGVVEATRAEGGLDVVFTKTIAFALPFSTESVALFVGISGWADHTASLVAGCLRELPEPPGHNQGGH